MYGLHSPSKPTHRNSRKMILDVSSPTSVSPTRRSEEHDTSDRYRLTKPKGSVSQSARLADDGNLRFTSSDDSSASSSSGTSASSALFAYREEEKKVSSSDTISSSSTASTAMCNKQAPTTPIQRKIPQQQRDTKQRASEISFDSTVYSYRDDSAEFEVASESGSPAHHHHLQKLTNIPSSTSPMKPPFSPPTKAENQCTPQTSPRRLSKNRVFATSPRRIVSGPQSATAAKPSLRAYVEQQQTEGHVKKSTYETIQIASPPQRQPSVETASSDMSDGLIVKEISFNPRDQLHRHLSLLSLGESVQPEELQARGIQPIIDISSTNGSADETGSSNPYSALRGNRPSLERRLSHLTLGNESYIMDLATQKHLREKERHEEALEETLERVQQLVNAMDPADRPDPDSEAYAIIFLRVLPQVKAALKLKYDEHDRQQDARLNEALMDELDKREQEKKAVDNAVYSGLADISEDDSSNSGSLQSRNRKVPTILHRAKEVVKTPLTGKTTDSRQPISTAVDISGDRQKASRPPIKIYDRATKNRACIKIQALVRRHMIRSVFAPLLEGVHAHERAQVQSRAAIKIQACFRRYSTCKLYLSLVGLIRDRKLLEYKSVVRIQAAYRMFRTRRFYVDVIAGVRQRRTMMERKAQEEKACIRLQAAGRKYLTRSFYLELVEGIKVRQLQLKKEEMAAIKIQSLCRSFLSRSFVKKIGSNVRKKNRWSKSDDWIEETVHDFLIEETIHEDFIDDGNTIDGSLEDGSFADERSLQSDDKNEEVILGDDESEVEYVDVSDYSDASFVEVSDEEYEAEVEVVEEGTKAVVSNAKAVVSSVTLPSPSFQGISRGLNSPALKARDERLKIHSRHVIDSTLPSSPTGRTVRSPSGKLADKMRAFDLPNQSNDVSPCVVKRSWQKPIAKINFDDDSDVKPKNEINRSVSNAGEIVGSAKELDTMKVENPFIINTTPALVKQKAKAQGGSLSWTPWTEDNSGSPTPLKSPNSRPKKVWKKPQNSEGSCLPPLAAGRLPNVDTKSWKNHIKIVADPKESKPELDAVRSTTKPVPRELMAPSLSTTADDAQETNKSQATKQKRSYQSALLRKKLIMVQKMMEACEDAKEMGKLKKKQISYLKALEDDRGEAPNIPQADGATQLDLGKKKGSVADFKRDVSPERDCVSSISTPVQTSNAVLDEKAEETTEIPVSFSQRKRAAGKVSINQTKEEDSTTLTISKQETEPSICLPESALASPIKMTENDERVRPSSKKAVNTVGFRSPLKKKSAGNLTLPPKGLLKIAESEKNEKNCTSAMVASAEPTRSVEDVLPPKSFINQNQKDLIDQTFSAKASSKFDLSPEKPKSGKLEVKRQVAGSASFQSPLKKKGTAADGDFDAAASTLPTGFHSPIKLKTKNGEVKSSNTLLKKGLGTTAVPTGSAAVQSPTKKKDGGLTVIQTSPKKTIVREKENTENGTSKGMIVKQSAAAGLAMAAANITSPSTPRKAKSYGNMELIKSPVNKPVGVKKVSSRAKEPEPAIPPLAKASKPVIESSDTETKSSSSGGLHYTLADFEQKRVKGVDLMNWEQFLAAEEFQKHFGMSKDEFSIQPKWQREKQKRKIRVGF